MARVIEKIGTSIEFHGSWRGKPLPTHGARAERFHPCPGQIWERSGEEWEIVDEDIARGPRGYLWARRLDDGYETDFPAHHLEMPEWKFVRGPKEETREEAVLRVAKRAMLRPPPGVTRERWNPVVLAALEHLRVGGYGEDHHRLRYALDLAAIAVEAYVR